MAFLSAGINSQYAAAKLHQLTDVANPADINLGNAAYQIGMELKKRPNNLKYIGDTIRERICGMKMPRAQFDSYEGENPR